ncbi:MAG: DUF6268 family outer membrane beta-barrel protein [Bacteroidota bacterium]
MSKKLHLVVLPIIGLLICVRPCRSQSEYRPKIAELSHRTLYNYNTRSISEEFGNANTEIEEDEQLKIRLGIPLIMKKGKLVGLQLKYDIHNFSMDFQNSNSELFNHIERRTFRSLGGRMLFQQSIGERKSYTLIGGAEIKSDQFNWNTNTMRFYASGSYKVKLNDRTEIGAGLLVGYTLGQFQIYPLLTYEHKLSNRFTVDLTLPKSAIMRFRGSDKFYISAKAEVKGWRYALHNSELSETNPLVLRKADLNIGLNFEREIHDWLWFGLDLGLTKNLRYHLGEPGHRRRDALVDLEANNAPYIQFGLFIVPPKKLYR